MRGLPKDMFRKYYARQFNYAVKDLEMREIAVFFGENKVFRHKQFSLSQLKKYLVEYVPSHVFYSVSLYSDPRNPDMEKKGYLGADIPFDIDADKFSCESYRECMTKAYYVASHLLDILREEIGVKPSVRFSGNRGYHVVIEDEKWRKLDKDGRRNLLEYILRGFTPGEVYISKYVLKPAIEIVRKFSEQEPFDVQVTHDIHRILRYPYSLHGKTGLAVIEIAEPIEDVDKLIEKASWAKGLLKVEVVERPGKKDVFQVDCTGKCTLPAQTALYLLLKGYAKHGV